MTKNPRDGNTGPDPAGQAGPVPEFVEGDTSPTHLDLVVRIPLDDTAALTRIRHDLASAMSTLMMAVHLMGEDADPANEREMLKIRQLEGHLQRLERIHQDWLDPLLARTRQKGA